MTHSLRSLDAFSDACTSLFPLPWQPEICRWLFACVQRWLLRRQYERCQSPSISRMNLSNLTVAWYHPPKSITTIKTKGLSGNDDRRSKSKRAISTMSALARGEKGFSQVTSLSTSIRRSRRNVRTYLAVNTTPSLPSSFPLSHTHTRVFHSLSLSLSLPFSAFSSQKFLRVRRRSQGRCLLRRCIALAAVSTSVTPASWRNLQDNSFIPIWIESFSSPRFARRCCLWKGNALDYIMVVKVVWRRISI